MTQYTEVSHCYYTLSKEDPTADLLAKELTWYSPNFSPKDVPRFYDVSSITEHPELFKKVVDSLVQRYKAMGDKAPTHILGFDARGFLLGTPVAIGLGIPFVLMRKAEKSPGILVKSEPYHKEYAEANPDTMAVRMGSVPVGSRVVLMDDLIATGGTAISGFQLVEALGATVTEFAAIVGIPFLDGVKKIHEYNDGTFKDVPVFTLIHDSAVGAENCADPLKWAEGKNRVLGFKEVIMSRQGSTE